jgi:hypothetical protein
MSQWKTIPRRRHVLARTFVAPLSDCLLVAALELMATVPPALLRWCAWPATKGARTCGRVFVGKKRQTWCQLHQEAARLERDRRAQEAHRERLRAREQKADGRRTPQPARSRGTTQGRRQR